MASRGGRGQRRPGPGPRRRGPPQREFPEAEELGSRTLEIENKKFIIEVKANDQGRFVKILETQTQGRGRIIFAMDKALQFRTLLNEFLLDYQKLPPAQDQQQSERLRTESFSQGRRRYYVDLRQNERGRFLKVTMLAGGKTFVAVPGAGLTQFSEALSALLDEFGAGGSQPGSPPAAPEPAPDSREVNAGGKKFFFDILKNDRGTFIKLSEVIRSGRRTHLNIPHSCWSKLGEVFNNLAQEIPYSGGDEETGSASGSEN